ncbi:MAG: T9SS type A sorting domain-containing protein [Flavobacteriaceae bacterium]|nr:T9SS type A sorting domain-containing protein [Flavobacteriaceae bacterium]
MKTKELYHFLILFFCTSVLFAQLPCTSTTTNGSGSSLDLYWVGDLEDGGSGDWTSPCSWRVGSVNASEIPAQAPRPKDNVYFVDASFTAGLRTVIVDSDAFCASLNMDSTFTNQFVFTCTFILNIGDANGGGFNLADTTYLTTNITGDLRFIWSGAYNINFSNQELSCRVRFDNAAGFFNFQSNLKLISNSWVASDRVPFDLVSGTINTNNYNLDIPSLRVVAIDAIFNGGTSTIDLFGAIKEPYNTSTTSLWSTGGLRLANATLNFNRVDTAQSITASTDQFGDVNFNTDGTFILSGVLNSTGDLYLKENTAITAKEINTTGNLVLESNTGIYLNEDITVGNIIQNASVNCTGPTFFRATSLKNITSQNNINIHDVILEYISASNSASDGCSSGAITYTATDVIDLGNNTCWDITGVTPKTLRWTGNGIDDFWSNANNWDLGCVPNSQDDVVFENMTGKTVDLDIEGNIKNMTWVNDGSTGTFTSTNSSLLNIYGDISLNTTMIWSINSYIFFHGASNTMDFSTQTLANKLLLTSANYTLLSNLHNLGQLHLSTSKLIAVNKIITINEFAASGSHLTATALDIDNTVMNILTDTSWYDQHGKLNITTTNGAIVNFLSTNPNITGENTLDASFELPAFTTISGSELRVFRNDSASLNVLGNVSIGGHAYFNGDGPLDLSMQNITINGDLNVVGGYQYFFPGGVTSKLTITGNFVATGVGCTISTQIKTVDGSGQIATDIQGSTTGFDYITLQNLDADGYSSPNVSNVIDLGGNDNWNFSTVSSPMTYYWRADSSSPTAFDGNWTDSNHWTVTQVNTIGDGGCAIPKAIDNVIFDQLSHDTTLTTVTVPQKFYCHDFSVNNSNIKFQEITESSFYINGSITADATFLCDELTFQGNYYFNSTDVSGETINVSNSLKNNIAFVSSGIWTLGTHLSIASNLDIYYGDLYSSGYDITSTFFNVYSNGSTIDFTGSTQNVKIHDLRGANNLTFMAPDLLEIKQTIYPLNFVYQDVKTVGPYFNILFSTGATFKRVDIDVNSEIQGSNNFDVLNYIPSVGVTGTHVLAGGETQTISSPNGQIIATGFPSGFLNIKSNNDTQAIIRKDYGDQMCWDFVILENLDGVEDTDGSSTSPMIFGGVNNNTSNLGGTLFDFTRGAFLAPTVSSGPDQNFCRRSAANIEFLFTNSGPYNVSYTDGTNNYTANGIAHGTTNHFIPVNGPGTYTILSVEGDNCSVFVPGSIIDPIQKIIMPPVSIMGLNGDNSGCYLGDENSWVHFISNNGNDRSLVSILDTANGASLGSTSVAVAIEPSSYVDGSEGITFMRRHVDITPSANENGMVRLYFTQSDLDNLNIETTGGTGIFTINDLSVRVYNNHVLDFSGGHQNLVVTNSGDEASVLLTEALDFTTSTDVYYLDVNTNTYGNFVIYIDPVALSNTDFEFIDHTIVLYPNPVSDKLTIRTGTNINIEAVIIHNVLGKEVLSFSDFTNANSTELPTKNLVSGVYLVTIKTNKTLVTKKIFIIK